MDHNELPWGENLNIEWEFLSPKRIAILKGECVQISSAAHYEPFIFKHIQYAKQTKGGQKGCEEKSEDRGRTKI